jgi:uncharacterized protein involved in exopolysaccharide biosynthesis
MLLLLSRYKRLIVRTVVVFTLFGVTYSMMASEVYRSSAKVVRETQSEGGRLPGGLASGALSGLGISLGSAGGGLTPQAFPDVLRSREVQMEVVRDTFRFPETGKPMTFLDYANRPPGVGGLILKYTIRLPWTLKSGLSDVLLGSSKPVAESSEESRLTEEEDKALSAISDMLTTSINEETGLMTIAVTAGEPRLAADLTQSFVDHMSSRIREIRTEKVRERLQFVKRRSQEAEEELEKAENQLAEFLEQNQNPTRATLQFQRERLRRQVRFKEQLYSDLQGQLTQTRLDLQRRQPVVTVVERAVPPLKRSAPQRTLIVVTSTLLGFFLGILAAFFKGFFETFQRDEEKNAKLSALQNRILPERFSGSARTAQ